MFKRKMDSTHARFNSLESRVAAIESGIKITNQQHQREELLEAGWSLTPHGEYNGYQVPYYIELWTPPKHLKSILREPCYSFDKAMQLKANFK